MIWTPYKPISHTHHKISEFHWGWNQILNSYTKWCQILMTIDRNAQRKRIFNDPFTFRAIFGICFRSIIMNYVRGSSGHGQCGLLYLMVVSLSCIFGNRFKALISLKRIYRHHMPNRNFQRTNLPSSSERKRRKKT